MRMKVHNINQPDETRSFIGNGHLDLVRLGELSVGKGVFEPGWKWSNDVKPIAGTDSCQAEHMAYVLKGRMKVVMDTGEQYELSAGDFCLIPSGHDAWVVGNETCELVDFGGFDQYAKPAARPPVTTSAMAGDEIAPAI